MNDDLIGGLFEGTPEVEPAKPKTRQQRKSAPKLTRRLVEVTEDENGNIVGEEAYLLPTDMPEPVVDEKISATVPTKTKSERKAVLFIDNEVGQPNYKFVGVNGIGYRIKRGEEVVVPESVVGVLENAKAFRPIKNADGSVTTQFFYTTPFRVLRWIEE